MKGMRIHANGTQLWFDVDGPALVPAGASMRERPIVILVHGGPGSYDHSYFKPHFRRLAEIAQVIYLDLRGHGRSARHDPATWTFEACADDIRALCDELDIRGPIVYGHSMGGMIAMLYAARHTGHAARLILDSTAARFDLVRLVEGFRRIAGDRVAKLAERDYRGDPVSDEEWKTVFAAFGPHVPTSEELARRIQNPELATVGMERLRAFDALAQLNRVASPTLICFGGDDPVFSVQDAKEILEALPPGVGRLAVIQGAGHFPWLDAGDRYWSMINDFVAAASDGD